MLSQTPPFKVNGVQTHLAEAGRSHTNHGFTPVSKVNVREVDIFAPHDHMTMDAQWMDQNKEWELLSFKMQTRQNHFFFKFQFQFQLAWVDFVIQEK